MTDPNAALMQQFLIILGCRAERGGTARRRAGWPSLENDGDRGSGQSRQAGLFSTGESKRTE